MPLLPLLALQIDQLGEDWMTIAMPKLSKNYPLNGVTVKMLSGEPSFPDTDIALPLSLAIEFI